MALRPVHHGRRAPQAKGLIDRFERLIELEGDMTPDDRQKPPNAARSASL